MLSFLTLVLVIGQVLNNIVIIALDTAPPFYDAALYYHAPRIISAHYPPATFALVRLFSFFFGNNFDAISIGVGTASFLLLLFAVFFIGRLYTPGLGPLAVCCLSCCPIVFGHARIVMADLLCAAMVAWSIYFMLSSQKKLTRAAALWLGLSTGLGMLTRVAFPLYVAIPLAITVFMHKGPLRKKCLFWAIFLAVACAVSCAWYVYHIRAALQFYSHIGLLGKAGIALLPCALRHNGFTLRVGIGYLALPMVLALALTQMHTLRKTYPLFFFAAWALPALIFLSYLDAQNARYIIPIIPAAVLMGCAVVDGIKAKPARNIVIALTVFLGILQTVWISYHASSYDGNRYQTDPLRRCPPAEWQRQEFGVLHPWRDQWNFEEIFTCLRGIRSDRKIRCALINIPNLIHGGLTTESKRKPGIIDIVWSYGRVCESTLREDDKDTMSVPQLNASLLDMDAVVLMDTSWQAPCKNYERLATAFRQVESNFVLVRSFTMPTQAVLKVYKKR